MRKSPLPNKSEKNEYKRRVEKALAVLALAQPASMSLNGDEVVYMTSYTYHKLVGILGDITYEKQKKK